MREDGLLLEPLGVDVDGERVYRYVLQAGHAGAAEVAQRFALPEDAALAVLDGLRASGLLARRADGGEFAPVDPRFALRVLADRQSERLARIREAVPVLAAQFDRVRAQTADVTGTRVLADADAIATWYVRLQHQAGREFLAFDRPPYVSASANPLEPVVLDRGVQWRAVYAASSFEQEGSWEEVGELAERGEQARIAPDLPVKLAIADRSVALVSLSLEPGTTEALVTEAPPLVAALCDLFDATWAGAVPIPTERTTDAVTRALARRHPGRAPRREATGEERALLTLMAAGLKDDVIARQLGMSPRTMRRRSQDLLAELGAANRFQAGAEAARRGWV